MAPQFEDQGGFATRSPSPPVRWATSMVLRRFSSQERVDKRRAKLERARRRQRQPHVVEYFHQVDDGYSHLAAQLLRPLADAYDIELVCHLVPGPLGKNAPEPELLLDLSRYDAAKIAPHYGLHFPAERGAPDAALVELATRILAGAGAAFADVAPLVGDALWSGSMDSLETLAERHSPTDATTASSTVVAGAARRKALGHYSPAMFHYAKEWYWGVDRLYHLENRLRDLGAQRNEGSQLLAQRPAIETGPLRDDGALTLEIYPSVRSPYTAIAFDQAIALAAETGVACKVRPVLPMVMRGAPVTREKGVYIFSDASREARATVPLSKDLPWGKVYDPIGNPVRRCYSLWPWARSQGRGVEFLSTFMHAAFREGINTGRDAGLAHVVEAAGLSWEEARGIVDNDDWEEEIEANRQAMYGFGLWGVPSFRLLDASGAMQLGVWGQDRLWLVSREIQLLLAEPTPSS